MAQQGFAKAVGQWAGTAEVYDGVGRFLGNAADNRNVQDVGDNRVRIDLSFVGPIALSGHYIIENRGAYRLYQGPANVGYAEALSDALVDSNAYWAAWGLTQRFFLYVTPDGQRQFSLGLLSRGDQLMYTVIGENHRVEEGTRPPDGMIVDGTAYDRISDPTAGRGRLLLHRNGVWRGEITALDAACNPTGSYAYAERVEITPESVTWQTEGGCYAPNACVIEMTTNGWQAWSAPGRVVGSYNLVGGRALSGHFHYLDEQLRVWRREVCACDGTRKAVVQVWYRGGERVGVQYGLLEFSADGA